MAKILIAGCGALGTELALALAAAGHEVTGLKRHPPTPPQLINYFAADITEAAQLTGLPTDFEQVFFILTADRYDREGYRAIYETGLDNLIQHFGQAERPPDWLMVSSTGVYSQNDGKWVDEDSPAQPAQPTTQWILRAEQRLTALSLRNIVVRFSGIYGPGRESLVRMARQSPLIQQHPPYYTNRIHQADCIGVLQFLSARRLAGAELAQYYLASDHDPAPMWEVISWLAAQLQCPAPQPKESTGGMNKRCSNRRLLELGYQFRYPDYKFGYAQVLAGLAKP